MSGGSRCATFQSLARSVGLAAFVAAAPALVASTASSAPTAPLPELERWLGADPDRLGEVDRVTGGTRRLGSATRFLVDEPATGDAEAIARSFAATQRALLGLTEEDLAEAELVDRVVSRLSGVTHLYFRQRHRGLPVHNGLLQVNVGADGRILSSSSQFVPNLSAAAGRAAAAAIPLTGAVDAAREELGDVELVLDVAQPQPMLLAIEPGVVRRVWNFDVASRDRRSWWNLDVDAADGRILTRASRISHAAYTVYEVPVEHPGHASPPPPADARTIAVDPHDPVASPFGWHDTDGVAGPESTLTTGNNVDAYTDTDGNNIPDPGSRPDGGAALEFAPPLDLTQAPSANRPAAVVNLFYWANRVHDIEYAHGFDEAAGNFQVNNYGRGGTGGDPVLAEAQEGTGTCGGIFAAGPDGIPGRLQAYVCAATTPARDGALDNFVQVHELGHGIGQRIVGGPSTTSCLGNAEQPGEGLSDFWGLSLTATPEQTGPTPRPVGTWLFGTLPNGIRPFPYSTDDAVNPHRYGSLLTNPGAHGVGAVFAQIYWEVYWALVDAHGFDADLANVTGTAADAGNLRAKLYLNEGLKNTPCGPGFVDVRDGVIAAVTSLYGGEDLCTVWTAFAAAGLGIDASQGSPNSTTDQVEGFALPVACELTILFVDGFESEDTSAWSATVP